MTVPVIDIHTDWGPPDARALLDACEDCVPAAIIRLGTIRTFERRRLERVIALHRLCGLFTPRALRRCRRDARRALDAEMDHRVVLLVDVARAHGIGGRA